jgi:hypothetical protein
MNDNLFVERIERDMHFLLALKAIYEINILIESVSK